MHKTITCLTTLILLQFSSAQVAASDPMLNIASEYEVFFRDLINDRNYPGAAFGPTWRFHPGTTSALLYC